VLKHTDQMDLSERAGRPTGTAGDVPLRDVIEAFLEQAGEGVVVTDRDDRIALMNRRAEDLFGYKRQELIGKPLAVLVPGGFPGGDGRGDPTREMTGQLVGRHKDGSELPVRAEVSYPDAGGVLAATAFVRKADPPPVDPSTNGPGGVVAEDGTPATEAPPETSVMVDPMTGLPGRMLFMDRLSVALARSGRRSSRVAVLLLDIDGFRLVNDSYGKATGDRLLAGVAERIFGALRPGDTVARIGEDEFAILCDDIARPEGAATIAERVHAAVAAPYPFDGEDVAVTAGLGFAVGSGRDHSPEALFRQAEEALHQAKAIGPGTIAAADGAAPAETAAEPEREAQPTPVEEAHEAVPAAVAPPESSTTAVEEARPLPVREVPPPQPPDELSPDAAGAPVDAGDELARALERSEFHLVYQPIVRLHTGRVTGVEALLRWDHPERGVVSPAGFMADAEESGLIHAMGTWVLRQAVADAERLQAAQPDGAPLMLSVNLSARQLADPNFADAVRGILAGSRVNPGTVYLEVGESSVMDDVEGAAQVLHQLRATGVRMTIDDFGTGFSSLLHLNRFPIDFIKVDRSFVNTLEQSTGSANIVTAVIAMAHALGLPAIAEGVETDVQLYSLRRLGCDYAQGYLFARPAPIEQVLHLLASDPAW
jgi:diguanylate cyclase (GGDEF)-like protein/PAS domain S-box-containing protein